jgi:hypothetical protein
LLVTSRAAFERLFHCVQTLLNHLPNRFGDFIGHQIRYPNGSTLVLALRENLHRRVVVSEGLAASRPRMSAGLIIDIDDELTHDHSIRKRNDAPVTFEFTVYYEAWYQTFVNGADIADRVPNKFFASLDFNFFVDSSHNFNSNLANFSSTL